MFDLTECGRRSQPAHLLFGLLDVLFCCLVLLRHTLILLNTVVVEGRVQLIQPLAFDQKVPLQLL